MFAKRDQLLQSDLPLGNIATFNRQLYIVPENDAIPNISLLITKQYPPCSTHALVPRPHLLQKLHEGTRRKLSLVSAPAGFGKTTLLKGWMDSAPLPIAWLSLDEHDNDPGLFWCYVITVLQDLRPAISQDLLSLQRHSVEEMLTALINEIATRPGDFALVLDNYHVITTEAIHHALTFLLEHLPSQFHLVLSSRADPPLPLARFRALGQVTEVRAADLRFSVDEAATFLNQMVRCSLSAENVAVLEARTEGWITGLHLAALALQQQREVDAFIKAFTGGQRHIVDYLTDEVLYTQPARLQTFLLETSILEQLCGSLCTAVTEQDDSQQLLMLLERSNLFLVCLDIEQNWYRYHQLFRDFLYQRLKHVYPQRVMLLHRRASVWYEKHDLLPQAIEQALAGKDFERAALLMKRRARMMLAQGEPGIVLRWLEALPPQEQDADAQLWLTFLHIWALLANNEPGKAEMYLEAVQLSVEREKDSICGSKFPGNELPGKPLYLEQSLSLRETSGAITAVVHQMFDVLPRDAEGRVAAVEAILSCMGLAYLLDKDIQKAHHTFSKLYRISEATKNGVATLFSLQCLANIQSVQGQLQQAYSFYQQARQLNCSGPAVGLISAGESLLSYQWNDLVNSTRLALEGIEFGHQLMHQATSLTDYLSGIVTLFTSYLSLAYSKHAQGDEQAAQTTLQEARQLTLNLHIPQLVEYIESEQVRLWLMQGKLEQAFQWKEQSDLSRETCLFQQRQNEYQVLARIYITQEKLDLAIQLLQDLLHAARSARLVADRITIQVLLTVALQRQGKQHAALAALEDALLLAEPQGYIRVFLDEGSTIAKLLSHLIRAPQHNEKHPLQAYIKKLLNAFATSSPDSKCDPPPSPLQDPLSTRELEVLQHLSDGMSNREIAQRLLVTVGTVKRHTNSIYSKLDVCSRLQAATQARVLGLV